VDPAAVERALRAHVRAMIVTPRAQNPTGATVSATRAADLRQILRRHPNALLIEIDPAGPVSGVPPVTLTDRSRSHWAVVRSTSKFLNPDLRVAVMASDPITAGRVQRRQAVGIRWVSHLLQALTLAVWSDPSSGRRLARASDVYRQRRMALIDALAAHGIDAHGKSGFNVWVPVGHEAATVSGLAARGWAVAAGERFRLRTAPAIRITTSALAPDEAQRFAADLVAAVRPAAATSA
jgi:DNA-binding transcriptional MocR family regulator